MFEAKGSGGGPKFGKLIFAAALGAAVPTVVGLDYLIILSQRLTELESNSITGGGTVSVDAVAEELVAKHSDTLRGEKGDPGKDGSTEGGDAISVEAVALELVAKHGDALRGEKGDPGKDGSTEGGGAISVETLARELVSQAPRCPARRERRSRRKQLDNRWQHHLGRSRRPGTGGQAQRYSAR